MTAYIVLAYPDHLAVYSDGAAYDRDGIYRAPQHKVDVMPHINALICTRGSGFMGMVLKQKLGTYQSFSDMKTMMHVELLGAATAAYAMGEDVNLEVIVAGIPDYDGPPEIFSTFIAGDDPLDREEGSLEIHDRGRFYAAPGLSDEDYAAAGMNAMEKVENAEDYYVAYMQALRAVPRPMHRDRKIVGCNVGGFIAKTVLGKGECGTKILHRWPDIIGQPLNGFQPYVEEEEAA